ncbi:hypothetical protein KQX54_003708 [Cotesia glomerata]|uniref:DNA-directed DNA polymerase n=1 Tax=Cotesia glomerata TaxID=32391 RepID=A0AAV7J3Y3_COTGL|nr:hypothetical protein KQX54_003708 [Cotesia glomerata]
MSPKPCLLVAHNATFDKSHLLRSILKCSMVPAFSKIAGFSDSLPLFKKNFTSKKILGEYKLSELAKNHLNINSDDKFYEALYDVEILEKLVSLTDNKYLFESSKSYRECLIHLKKLKKTASGMDCLSPLKGVLSGHILRKMAFHATSHRIPSTDNSTYFSTMKDELAGKIAASSKACSEDIAKLRGELNADNAAIRKELETIKLRVADLESNTLPADGSKTTARELEKHMVAASINAVEKHIRRNNIIIRGLSCTESNIKEAVSEFLDKHFKISNGIVEATFPNKTKD